jgi:hypothetical protein
MYQTIMKQMINKQTFIHLQTTFMNRKYVTFLFFIAFTILVTSCNNDSKTAAANTEATAHADDHEHVFACPMHPEVTGKEGDTCPKCGMRLEHSDAAPATSVTYFMDFATPANIEPAKEVTLSLTPKKKGAEKEQVALDVQHEKKIHLILVSDDLSWFDHIHPEYIFTLNTVQTDLTRSRRHSLQPESMLPLLISGPQAEQALLKRRN